MNAKELRQAAEYIVTMWDNHDSKRIVAGDELFFNSDGEPDSVTFARHILSTVREDDDEQVTEERIKRCGFSPNAEGTLELKYDYDTWLQFTDGGRVWVDMGDGSVCVGVVNNMGQFRSLCRGLGIELKEVERVD